MGMYQTNMDKNRLRSYAGIFSSTAFNKLLRLSDISFIHSRIQRYDMASYVNGEFVTYMDYIRFAYENMGEYYRNEYYFKNSFINELLIKKYGLKETITLSEFKVGNSIADIVMFNGTSKAFEIKTEFDSKKRLQGQLSDYQKVFNQNYIITDASLIDKYLEEDISIGLIALQKKKKRLELKEVRPALENKSIDANVAMRCLRTKEYQAVVKEYYSYLPQMTSFNMFAICLELIKEIPQTRLNDLFISAVKSRRSNTSILNQFEAELRQLALAMNLNQKNYQCIIDQLNNPIKL